MAYGTSDDKHGNIRISTAGQGYADDVVNSLKSGAKTTEEIAADKSLGGGQVQQGLWVARYTADSTGHAPIYESATGKHRLADKDANATRTLRYLRRNFRYMRTMSSGMLGLATWADNKYHTTGTRLAVAMLTQVKQNAEIILRDPAFTSL
jgi:hypothetical protein